MESYSEIHDWKKNQNERVLHLTREIIEKIMPVFHQSIGHLFISFPNFVWERCLFSWRIAYER